MRGKKQGLSDLAPQAAQKNINVQILRAVEIPVPPLATQREIIADLESERKLVDANRELIVRMEQKTQAKLAEIWGEPAEASSSARSMQRVEERTRR